MIAYHVTNQPLTVIKSAAALVTDGTMTTETLRSEMLAKGYDLGGRLYNDDEAESAINEYLEGLGQYVYFFSDRSAAVEFAEVNGLSHIIEVNLDGYSVRPDPTDKNAVRVYGNVVTK